MCQNQQGADGKPEPLNTDYWNEQADSIAALGQRVLAFAAKSVKPRTYSAGTRRRGGLANTARHGRDD